MNEPVKVYDWPIGYCDNATHWGTEHPLYTSSDNGCKNFISSERLLEIKQLFDLTAERDEAKKEQAWWEQDAIYWKKQHDSYYDFWRSQRYEIELLRSQNDKLQAQIDCANWERNINNG
jgi:hypothetical protein